MNDLDVRILLKDKVDICLVGVVFIIVVVVAIVMIRPFPSIAFMCLFPGPESREDAC